ncbi:MAG: TrkH family potassium uptake protein, partial [Deinococcota bacterium]|nr:TrkH family potassium uptake protein [Deinococcota bacterium]
LLSSLLGIFFLLTGSRHSEPGRREAITGVLLLWLIFPLLGALPFAISGGFDFLDAFFESMSGFTTTGATMLREFEGFPLSLFMWRALSQWLGGVGIIVFFIAVLPQLALAGRQMFFAEVPGPTEEKLTPRLRNTATAVTVVYLLITVAAILSYWAAGMPFYDAVANGLTTPASGGFSPNGLSFAGYDSALLDWLAVLFMTLAGANFALQYRVLLGRPGDLLQDREFQAYLAIVLVAAGLLTYTLRDSYAPFDALRHGFFQSLTMITTTGYASADFALWPEDAQAVLVFLMFVGGSAGSAAGGIKVARWLIIGENSARELRRALHPRLVAPVRVGNRTVSEEVLRAVSAFVTLFAILTALTTVTLALLGADLTTAFTAAIACVGNIGPGLAAVGPMQHFADLHPVSKAVLIFGMYAGRLEIITVFIVLNADFWQLPRLNWFRRGSPFHD